MQIVHDPQKDTQDIEHADELQPENEGQNAQDGEIGELERPELGD